MPYQSKRAASAGARPPVGNAEYTVRLETRGQGPQRGGEPHRVLAPVHRFLENQRAQAGQAGRRAAMALVGNRKLAGGQVLQAEQRQLEAVLDADFLEKPGEV